MSSVIPEFRLNVDEIVIRNEPEISTNAMSPILIKENILAQNPHNKSFFTESPAVEYINGNPNKNLYIYGEDKNANNGAKKYYVLDRKTIYQLSTKKIFNFYEYFGKDDPIKLYNDIDIPDDHVPKNIDKKDYFDSTINNVIELMKKNLEIYIDISKLEIIILSSCRNGKQSAHIIYNNVHFENVYAMKIFIFSINSSLIKENILDPSVYRKGCLRLLWNSKLGKSNNLSLYKMINYDCANNKQLFMDTLLLNINKKSMLVKIDVPKNIKIEKKIRPISKRIIENKKSVITDNICNNMAINEETLQKYLDILNIKRADKYNDWISIGMIIFNCQPNLKGFNLWDKWSSKSPYYCGRDLCVYKWNSFKFTTLGIGTLKFYARNDNPELYDSYTYNIEEKAFDTVKFNLNYLLSENEKINDKKTIVTENICKWIDSDIKTLAIKSTYNTGKTCLCKKIIKNYSKQFKKILFVSYRQTLAHELHGSFGELNVQNYLQGNFQSERLICSVESLHKIIESNYAFDDDIEINSYDLVVLDEIESILNHFESSTIDNKEDTFNLLTAIIHNSNKVLALDGDFHNRSYEYIKDIGSSIILENEIQKNKKHYKFTYNKTFYDKQIDDDLKNGKNIIIVSMSSSIADGYKQMYGEKYKTVLHTSKTNDKLKEKIKNVNSFWILYQLIIYSPQLESGVSFDREHIDRIYVVLSSKSTSSRGLLQMIGRCRKVRDDNILVYLNSVPYKTKANFYAYNEVKEYVIEMFTQYLSKKIKLNKETNKKVYKYDLTLYSKIMIHNIVEKMNKGTYYFVPHLIKLLSDKGHTYEFLKDDSPKKEINKGIVMKQEILLADDIDRGTYHTLEQKTITNKATREDKMKMEKYMLKINWKVNEITEDFMEKFYGKTHVLFNLRWLIDSSKIEPYVDIGNNISAKFSQIEILEKVKIIQQLLQKLGYENVRDTKKIEKEIFIENMKKVLNECEIFINSKKCEPLFEFKKGKINTVKSFLGCINTVLKQYGVQIKLSRKNKKVKGKFISINFYCIYFIDNINNYI